MEFLCASVNKGYKATTVIFTRTTDDQLGPSREQSLTVTFDFDMPTFHPGKTYILAMNAGGIALSEKED